MNAIDIIIVAAVGVVLFFAVRKIVKAKKSGDCAGCAGCAHQHDGNRGCPGRHEQHS